MDRIIYVQQVDSSIRHIKDDSGRLYWDMLCADQRNTAGSWSSGDILAVNCQVCLSIYKQQNEVLEDAGLVRSDAKLLYSGLFGGNIQRFRVQHLIDGGVFTGSPAIVGWWENGKWRTRETDDEWTACKLTENGNVIAKNVWHAPFLRDTE